MYFCTRGCYEDIFIQMEFMCCEGLNESIFIRRKILLASRIEAYQRMPICSFRWCLLGPMYSSNNNLQWRTCSFTDCRLATAELRMSGSIWHMLQSIKLTKRNLLWFSIRFNRSCDCTVMTFEPTLIWACGWSISCPSTV